MAITLNPMTVGQTQRIHLQAFAQDNAHSTSQVVDSTSTLAPGSATPGVATIAMDAANPRDAIVTAVGVGNGTVFVNESPSLPVGTAPVFNVAVSAAAPPDNRRIDVLGFDSPS